MTATLPETAASATNGSVGHDWRLVAPWYRWARKNGAEPHRTAEAARPALHKYVSTDFVTDFLSDPQRSVTFDEVDRYHRVEAIVDTPLPGDTRRRFLATKRLVATDTRKLFLPAHQRHYVVAVGLHCTEPGFPMVDPGHVAQAGFVIRRHKVDVPAGQQAAAAALMRTLTAARVREQSQRNYQIARSRSRLLTPFRTEARRRLADPGGAAASAHRRVQQAKRELALWAAENDVARRTEGWVASGDGTFGAWVPLAEEPEDVVEHVYPLRALAPSPTDPEHAAHDGTIYWGAVPTASDEVTPDGTARFNDLDTYEIRVFVRADEGDCPGPPIWSQPSQGYRLASFFDPAGCAQRPTEVRLPDFGQLEASSALPSVKMTAPDNSSLEFAKNGEIPKKGQVGGGEICFFSIPLITIVAMFVLNIFLPIVIFVFGLWWMLKLKLCIPPSIQIEADLEAELDVVPGGIQASADFDVDVDFGGDIDQTAVQGLVSDALNPESDPNVDPEPPDPDSYQFGDSLTGDFTNDPLLELLARQGYGSDTGAPPPFQVPHTYTSSVRRDEVVHP